MGSGFHCAHVFGACRGLAAVVTRGSSEVPGAMPDVGLALAATLAEREAQGKPAKVIILRLTRRDDAGWAGVAVNWLAQRGRRVVVRSAAVLGRELIDAVRGWGATVVLELAHPRPSYQRALIGPSADTVAALLLHAQHLRSLDIEVAVHLGPLLPVIHEQKADVIALARHIAAADIRDVHLTGGRLTPGREEALVEVLPQGQYGALLRAFGLDRDLRGHRLAPTGVRLPARVASTVLHGVRRWVEEAGLRVDHCGCPAHCHLDPELTPSFVPLLTSDLFERVGIERAEWTDNPTHVAS